MSIYQTKDDIRPATHKKEPTPKTTATDDGARWKVIDSTNPAKVFGAGLPLVEAKKLASRLSSSHTCRTAKLEPDVAVKRQGPGVRPILVKRPPPPAILANSVAAATQAAAEANARHEAIMARQNAENGLRDKLQTLTEAIGADVEADADIMGEADDGDVEIDGVIPDDVAAPTSDTAAQS